MMASILAFLQAHIEGISVAIVDGIILLIPSFKSSNIAQLLGNICADISSALKNAINEPADPKV